MAIEKRWPFKRRKANTKKNDRDLRPWQSPHECREKRKGSSKLPQKKLRPHQAALLLTVFLWGWGSYVAKGKTYVPWSNHYVHKPISWIDDHPRIWAIYQDMTMAHMGFCKLMFIRFISQSLVSLYSHIPLTPPGSSGKSWTANLLNNTIPTDAKQ